MRQKIYACIYVFMSVFTYHISSFSQNELLKIISTLGLRNFPNYDNYLFWINWALIKVCNSRKISVGESILKQGYLQLIYSTIELYQRCFPVKFSKFINRTTLNNRCQRRRWCFQSIAILACSQCSLGLGCTM